MNGIPFHSWSNGRSYHESQNWYEIAIEWNKYELDICLGMSKGGEYHRKFNFVWKSNYTDNPIVQFQTTLTLLV